MKRKPHSKIENANIFLNSDKNIKYCLKISVQSKIEYEKIFKDLNHPVFLCRKYQSDRPNH